MEEENKQAQEDELMALSSIFDADVFTVNDEKDCNPGGTFTCVLDLPQPFDVVLSDAAGDSQQFTVQFLPDITLHVSFPTSYPSTDPPNFTLVCKWLKKSQLIKLCQKLDEIWEENKGEVVLFLWTDFLKNDLVEFLDICSPLDLSHTVVPYKQLNNSENAVVESVIYDPRAIQDIASQDLLLRAIVDFDTKQSEHRFNSDLFTCKICFSERFGKQCLRFSPCQHVFCTECLKTFFELYIREGNVLGLVCPEDKCETTANPAHVQWVVGEELFKRYDRLLLQSSLDTMSDIVYCPRKSCEHPVIADYDNSMGSCASCSHHFCIFCKQTYHGIAPCKIKSKDMQALRSAYVASTGTERKEMERRYGKHVLRQLVEDSFSEDWLRENSKQCPHCNTHIEKVDGCNKMTCTKCRTFFCWLCGAHLPKSNPYVHFNSPGNGCFNLLFQGVQTDEFEDEEEVDPDFWFE